MTTMIRNAIRTLLAAALLAALACGQQSATPSNEEAAVEATSPAATTDERPAGWRLADTDSPYLRQHADNAVEWYPWGEEAFSVAQARDVPIFLSVGYSTCHWCHVMEHESFTDPAIGKYLAEHFVSIKVDREQHPDVDAHYMRAVQAITGRGGWPMTVFLTPDGKPFTGGTYYPPDDRYGAQMPSFRRLLEQVVAQWTDNREGFERQADEILAYISTDPTEVTGDWDPELVLGDATSQQIAMMDPVGGGTQGAPKFPPSMRLQFMLRQSLRLGPDAPPALVDLAELTLDKMASGGMRDQVGGGFHRYSTDANWRVPHFEKMLYDNALLVETYAEAFALTGEARHARVARDTLAWVLSDMVSPEALFDSARDADSLPFDASGRPVPDAHAEEGLFYLWTPEQVTAVLGDEDAAAFARLFDVTPGGNFEGRSIPRPERTDEQLMADPGADLPTGQEFLTWLADVRARLTAARATRPQPLRDEKALAAWNGLMLSGLARAGALLDDDELRAATLRHGHAMLEHFVAADPLPHQVFEGRASGDGDLADHAMLGLGLLDAHEATADPAFLAGALDLAARMIARFEDTEGGGFYTTEGDDPLLPLRRRETHDGAIPAGSSAALELLLRLAPLDTTGRFDAAARRALGRVGPMLGRRSAAWPGLLAAVDAVVGPLAVVVIDGDDDAAAALAAQAGRALLPSALVLPDAQAALAVVGEPAPAALAPAREDGDGGQLSRAWICVDGVCTDPVSTPDRWAALLADAVRRRKP